MDSLFIFVTISVTILSILIILLSYMKTILCHHMVRITYNTVAISAIFTILYNNIVIIYGISGWYQYGNNIVETDNIVNNIVRILFTILSDLTTLLTVLLHCWQYCYNVSTIFEQFRRSLLMFSKQAKYK